MMASQGYTAMKGVLELPYGGFVSTFGNGGTKDPPTTPEKITEGLGKKWVLGTIVVKPYASMAATHATIDGILKIQNQHVDAFKDVDAVDMIRVEMSDGAFKKGGWAPTRPTDSTSAQMSGPYAGATQIIDNAVLAAQFSTAALERDEVWQWVNKFKCEHSQDLDIDEGLGLAQRLTVTFKDSSKQKIEMKVAAPKGIDPLLSNEEIVEKYELLTKDVTSVELRDQIKNMVLSLDEAEDVGRLVELLSRRTRAIPGF
jgi:aconitate decarboxylase